MQEYNDGQFGCFSDIKSCLFTFFCLVCQNQVNWAKVSGDGNFYWLICCEPVHPVWVRKAVLKKNGLDEDHLMDCLCTTFCAECVICQDARALGNDIPVINGDTKVDL